MKPQPLIKVLISAYGKLPRSEQKYMLASIVIFSGIIISCSGILSGMLVGAFDGYSHSYYYSGFIHPSGRKLTCVMLLVVAIVLLVAKIKPDLLNDISYVDDRGVVFMEDYTHGSAREKTSDEIRKDYDVVTPEKIQSQVYGYLPETKETVCEKVRDGEVQNQTMMICGASGTGKTVSANLPIIYCALDAGENIFVSDPKGELHRLSGDAAVRHGYKKYVLNLDEVEYSSCWDCLQDVIDVETERLSDEMLKMFCSVYIINLNPPDKQQQAYFIDGAKNLLEAIIGYCAYRREHAITMALASLYTRIASNLREYKENRELFNEMISKDGEQYYQPTSIKRLKKIIYDAAMKTGHPKAEIDDCIYRIESEAPVFSMGEVYFILSNFYQPDVVFKYTDTTLKTYKSCIFDEIPAGHIARESYKGFEIVVGNPQVSTSITSNILNSLSLFTSRNLRIVLSNQGIDLKHIREEKNIVYVIFKNGQHSLHPILSLFFTFAVNDCDLAWKRAENQEAEDGTPNTLRPVVFLLEEFASLGRIGGDSVTLSEKLSTIRSSKIRFIMSIQFIDQLKSTYGDGKEAMILGNCEKIVFLGCNDSPTAHWISEMTGVSTVLNTTFQDENKSLSSKTEAEQTLSTCERPLFTIDEIIGFKKREQIMVIAPKLGNSITILDRFPYFDHPYYKNNNLAKLGYKVNPSLSSRIRTENFKIDNSSRDKSRVSKNFNQTEWETTVSKILKKVRKSDPNKNVVYRTSIYDYDEQPAEPEAGTGNKHLFNLDDLVDIPEDNAEKKKPTKPAAKTKKPKNRRRKSLLDQNEGGIENE